MNIGGLLARSAQVFPDRLAISQGERRLTYAQFDARVNRLANALTHLGLEAGDRLAMLIFNCPQMLEALFAAFKAGLAAVPINFRLHPAEYAYIVAQSRAKAMVLGPEFNEPVLRLRDRLPQVGHFLALADAGGELKDYETVLAQGGPEFAVVDVAPDDPAWLFYTSGTTGRPKGVTLSHRNLLAMTWCYYADF